MPETADPGRATTGERQADAEVGDVLVVGRHIPMPYIVREVRCCPKEGEPHRSYLVNGPTGPEWICRKDLDLIVFREVAEWRRLDSPEQPGPEPLAQSYTGGGLTIMRTEMTYDHAGHEVYDQVPEGVYPSLEDALAEVDRCNAEHVAECAAGGDHSGPGQCGDDTGWPWSMAALTPITVADLNGDSPEPSDAERPKPIPALGICPRCGGVVGMAHSRPECDEMYDRARRKARKASERAEQRRAEAVRTDPDSVDWAARESSDAERVEAAHQRLHRLPRFAGMTCKPGQVCPCNEIAHAALGVPDPNLTDGAT